MVKKKEIMKRYDVTFTLKWDKDIELCIGGVEAPSPEKAYWGAMTRIEESNKREYERGKDNRGPLLHTDIWRKQAKVVEIIEPERSWLSKINAAVT